MSGLRKKPRERSEGGLLRRATALVSAALVVAGSALAVAGAPASATGGDNKDCPEGYVFVAKAEWKGGSYQFEGSANGVTVNGDAEAGTFTSSTLPIGAVVIKGSTDSDINYYNPPVTSGSFSNVNLSTSSGNTPEISHLTFCALPEEPGDTVTVPSQETVDPCNPEGVENNVAWKSALPADTDKIDWSESNDGATRTATLKDSDDEWSDGTKAPKVFNLPADSGVKCEVEESCPSLTGSIKTTTADGTVVNGNIYQNKSDVYVYGEQLPDDVTTVYVRVTDPSGSTVLSDVKEVTVTDGSFGPVQLPAFDDTPNNGDEYKVWVSTQADFSEPKCTKFDNFKVKGDKPDEDKEVTPAQPTATTPSCEMPNMTVTPSSQEGVVWSPSGPTVLEPGESVTYTATPDDEYVFPEGAQTSWEYTNTFDVEECDTDEEPPTFNPDGSLDVNCKGDGTAVLDNSQSTDGDVENGGTVGFELYTSVGVELFMVPAGETQTVEFTGAEPGSQVILRALDQVVDTATVPTKCGKDNPPPPKCPPGTTGGDTNGNGVLGPHECDKPDGPVTTTVTSPPTVPTSVDAGLASVTTTPVAPNRGTLPLALGLMLLGLVGLAWSGSPVLARIRKK
jgi:hypothetical protein